MSRARTVMTSLAFGSLRAPLATLRRSSLRWLRRYLPAELVGTPCALLCGWAAAELTGSTAVVAVAATWGENLGFYGLMLGRELRQRGSTSFFVAVRDLFVEFGPAEALDSFVVRPGALYAGLALAPNPALGYFAGKLAADLSFYAPAILTHELQRGWARIASRDGLRSRRLLPVLAMLVCLSFAAASFA